MTFRLNYKENKYSTIEENKSRGSLLGDKMLHQIHFDPDRTSARMLDRVLARMVISQSVETGWTLENFDISSSFLHEEHKYHKAELVKELARVDGSFKHGNKIGILRLKLYVNISEIFYYIDVLLELLQRKRAQMSVAEVLLVRLEMYEGKVIMAIAAEDFLGTASTPEAMDVFYIAMTTKCNNKRLGRQRRYVGWNLDYYDKGWIAWSQPPLIDKTVQDGDMLTASGRNTPYLA